MRIKTYIKIAFIIIWLCVIFSFSAQDAKKSSHTSDQVIIKAVETIKKEKLTTKQKETITTKYVRVVRKSAHFFLYFVLGIFIFLLAKEISGITLATIIYTIIFCMLYACSDELHQLFVNGRCARIFDVFVDTCGATLSTMIMFTISKIKSRLKV